jgi:hypothetical protein
MRNRTQKTIAALAVFIAIPTAAYAAIYYHRMFDPKHGGSACYCRTYSGAFLKKNPDVKLTAIALERRNSVSGVTPNSKELFGVTFGASTKGEDYKALADCRGQGSVITCQVESDGGTFTVQRVGKGAIIKTRRIAIEGLFKDLEIASKKGKPARSFTLTGTGKQPCAAVLD